MNTNATQTDKNLAKYNALRAKVAAFRRLVLTNHSDVAHDRLLAAEGKLDLVRERIYRSTGELLPC